MTIKQPHNLPALSYHLSTLDNFLEQADQGHISTILGKTLLPNFALQPCRFML